MHKPNFLLCAILSLCVAGLVACKSNNNASTSWSVYFPNTGTYSSARMADLNRDGVLDIIIGAGGKEEVYSDTAVLALDGANGKALWAIPGANQYVGSAIFLDITNDGIPEVFIGGRWALLTAIDGSNGKPVWSFYSGRKQTDGSDGGWFNFTTPQLIPDQDADGLMDLLIANGGDARVEAGDPNRPAGRLLVLSSRSGKILANVVMPDGRETYMSVICEKKAGGIDVYFGTGGESLGGHLYRTTLHQIMSGDISAAKALASSENKGFIGSPVLVDITGDKTKDIVINTVDGRMLAINGANDSLLWELQFPGTEAYTIPAVGYFNGDSIPDLFANFAIGTFPRLNWSVRFMVDGKTGQIAYRDTIPAFQYASPVVADLDGDGFDEVIVNQGALKRKQFEDVYYSNLLAFDFRRNTRYALGDTLRATNLASTPWIGDMDNDGRLDIIYTAVNYHDTKFDLSKPLGLSIARFNTGINISSEIRWGAYLGSNYDGNF